MNDGRPAPYHHGDLRTALVDGALDQLRDHGADGVSLRAVATATGVSPSAAYHHFPSKTALLVAVGERVAEQFSGVMGEAWRSVPGDDDAAAVARIEALGRAYIGFALTAPHLFRHMFGPLCAAAFGDKTDGAPEEVDAPPREDGFGLLLRALHDLAARGLLRGGDVEGTDLLAWTTVHGFATLAMDGWLAPEAGEPLFHAIRRTLVVAP